MPLNFPNQSRNYNESKNQVQFWGYDSALEISFFIASDVLQMLDPQTTNLEATCLATFDAAVEKIHAAARKKYRRNRADVYYLAVEDFYPACLVISAPAGLRRASPWPLNNPPPQA